MAYPMVAALTFGEFKARADVVLWCLERTHKGKVLQCPLPKGLSDDEYMLPTFLSYVCSRLKIDPEDFGIAFK